MLNRALERVPGDGEALLALGQVFMQEGDLLAAEERFREAERYLPDRARAWQAVVARRSGRLDAAVRLLEPLVKRFPRDTRLRFELGRALMELLRHREAVAQFEALLEADPLDVAGHHNLMQCWQRLNRPAEARREEALYKLLAPLEEAEAPPLRVFTLERVP
jgi:cytochrome c-type biogenesis protein CcmH/NrfG